MPRQNPNMLGTASNLRNAAAAVRAAASAGDFQSLVSGLAAVATGFEQAADVINAINSQLADAAQANTNVPGRRAPFLLSGDRINGGVSIQGGLRTTAGQSVDITLENQVGDVSAFDHAHDVYLPLDVDGSSINLSSHGGTVRAKGDTRFAGLIVDGKSNVNGGVLPDSSNGLQVAYDSGTLNAYLWAHGTGVTMEILGELFNVVASATPLSPGPSDPQWFAQAGTGQSVFVGSVAVLGNSIPFNDSGTNCGTPGKRWLKGHFRTARIDNLAIFANNAAAIAGLLVAGDLYRTGADPDVVCVVH